MAQEQSRTAGQQMSRGSRVKFWIGFVVVVVAAVTAVVVTLQWSTDERDEQLEQLNDRYVEQIEFRSESVRNTTKTLIVIDGVTRRDCEEEDGRLECTDDPQPTEE